MLEAIEPAHQLPAQEIRKMVTELGDMARVLDEANRDDLAELYKALGLAISYTTHTRGPMSPSARVWLSPLSEWGTRTSTTRLDLTA
jgi:hypothetical protein